jgi:hypothetical protein
MTGATFCQWRLVGVWVWLSWMECGHGPWKGGWGKYKDQAEKKTYGLPGSCASLVYDGGVARIGCARRRLGDWWTRREVETMTTRALSGGYPLVQHPWDICLS